MHTSSSTKALPSVQLYCVSKSHTCSLHLYLHTSRNTPPDSHIAKKTFNTRDPTPRFNSYYSSNTRSNWIQTINFNTTCWAAKVEENRKRRQHTKFNVVRSLQPTSTTLQRVLKFFTIHNFCTKKLLIILTKCYSIWTTPKNYPYKGLLPLLEDD